MEDTLLCRDKSVLSYRFSLPTVTMSLEVITSVIIIIIHRYMYFVFLSPLGALISPWSQGLWDNMRFFNVLKLRQAMLFNNFNI